MTSLLTNQKVNVADIGYYINVGDLRGRILSRTSEPSGANTGTNGGSFSTASWSWSSIATATGTLDHPGSWSSFSTSLATAGRAILRDMGRTIISSSRTFRKIQYVVPAGAAPSTSGVSGNLLTGENYLTGYIELGFGGDGGPYLPTPVAHYGR